MTRPRHAGSVGLYPAAGDGGPDDADLVGAGTARLVEVEPAVDLRAVDSLA